MEPPAVLQQSKTDRLALWGRWRNIDPSASQHAVQGEVFHASLFELSRQIDVGSIWDWRIADDSLAIQAVNTLLRGPPIGPRVEAIPSL
jgi:hypothetical protein